MTLTCPNYPFHTRFTGIVNRTVLVEVNEEGHAIRDIEQFMEKGAHRMSTEDRLNTNLDAMADAILNSRSPRGAALPPKLCSAEPDVVIAIRGGVAEVIENVQGLFVEIVDYDNGETYPPIDGYEEDGE